MEDASYVWTTAICKSCRSTRVTPQSDPLLYIKGKIMQWNFLLCQKSQPFITQPHLSSNSFIVFVQVAAPQLPNSPCPLTAMSCYSLSPARRTFPISPSGKSQLFLQVPPVIEFAAEISAWKISFSLLLEFCVYVCMCECPREHPCAVEAHPSFLTDLFSSIWQFSLLPCRYPPHSISDPLLKILLALSLELLWVAQIKTLTFLSFRYLHLFQWFFYIIKSI